jgi:hypothetical protein
MNFPSNMSSLAGARNPANTHGYNSPEFSRTHQLQPLVKRDHWVAPGSATGSESKAVQTDLGYRFESRPGWALETAPADAKR